MRRPTERPPRRAQGQAVTPEQRTRAAGEHEQTRASAARRLEPAPNGNPALDRLAGLASRLLSAASAQVSLLSADQLIAGGSGLQPGAVGSRSPSQDSLCRVTADLGAPLLVTDAVADQRVAALPPVASGAVASYLGVPLVADDGHIVGALCVYDAEPRSWSDGDVATLNQLAASAVAELELTALSAEYLSDQLVWQLALDAARVGTFVWDVASGVLVWDARMLDLFGYDADSFDGTFEAFETCVHPEDRVRLQQALQRCIDTCGDYEAEYRITRPDGATRWVAARGRAICGQDGQTVKVLGAAHDSTGGRDAEARTARVLESMAAGFLALDRDWRITCVNSEAERIIGPTRSELTGRTLWEAFPATVGSLFESGYRSAVERNEPVSFEAYYPAPMDAWYEVKAWPNPDGLTLYFLDITARRTAQVEAARASIHAVLVADVASELAMARDAEDAAMRLAKLVIPTLGDWCIVTLVDDSGHVDAIAGARDVGWWHHDAALRETTKRYAEVRQGALSDQSMAHRALRSGLPVLVPSGAVDSIGAVLTSVEARALCAALNPESSAAFPLRARGRTLGLLSIYHGPERGAPSQADLATAADIGTRAGLALDNLRLYAQQQLLAQDLQRSLLTAPPQPDHMQIAVRYEPAVEAAQVGGDWYDAFLQPDGGTVLVIGDVVGHDTAAAAAMGQLRSLLRGIAAHTGAGPADVLRGVDQVMQTLKIETTATAVVARVEQSADERSRGVTWLRWSNAGHPPPMVIAPDGTVAVLTGDDADLLLGIEPTSRRAESTVVLDRGSTVLLYTDGLVERRGQSLDEGLMRLRDLLIELAPLSLDELCDGILRRLAPERPEDDVALVAVRLHPQDQPRPVEAGPTDIPENVAPEPPVTQVQGR